VIPFSTTDVIVRIPAVGHVGGDAAQLQVAGAGPVERVGDGAADQDEPEVTFDSVRGDVAQPAELLEVGR
jgi:hypothetical protein